MTNSLVSTGFPSVDTISIGGVPAPGQWILLNGAKEYGWQIQKGFAQSGATVIPTGDELAKPMFLIRIWTESDFDLFRTFRRTWLKKAVVSPSGGLTPFALGITHPELAELGVTSVVILKSPWLTNNGKGLWTGTCEFLQYRKPVPALGKPNAAIPGASTPKPKATDKLQAQIQKNSAEIAAARGP